MIAPASTDKRCIDRQQLERFIQLMGLADGEFVLARYPHKKHRSAMLHFRCTIDTIPYQELEQRLREEPTSSLCLVVGEPLPVPEDWGSDIEHFHISSDEGIPLEDRKARREHRWQRWNNTPPAERHNLPGYYHPKTHGAQNTHIRCNRDLCAEADQEGFSIEDQLKAWEVAGLPKPSFFVITGGKSVHNHWAVEAIPNDGRKLFRHYQKGLAGVMQAQYPDIQFDISLCSPSHPMRCPGWFHPNTGRPTVLHEVTDRVYTLADFDRLLPIAPPTAVRVQRRAPRKPRTEAAVSNAFPGQVDPDQRALTIELLSIAPVVGLDYDTWRNLIWAIHSVDVGLRAEAHRWSAQDSAKYDGGQKLDDLWDDANQGGGIQFGTLYHYVKQTNPAGLEALRKTSPHLLRWWDENRSSFQTSACAPTYTFPPSTGLVAQAWHKDAYGYIDRHINSSPSLALLLLVAIPPGAGKTGLVALLAQLLLTDHRERRMIYATIRWKADVSAPNLRSEFRQTHIRHSGLYTDSYTGYQLMAPPGELEGITLDEPATCRIYHSAQQMLDQMPEYFDFCPCCPHVATCAFPAERERERASWVEGASYEDRQIRGSAFHVLPKLHQLQPPQRREVTVVLDESATLENLLIRRTVITAEMVAEWQKFVLGDTESQYLTGETRLRALEFLHTLQNACSNVCPAADGTPAKVRWGNTPDQVQQLLRPAAEAVGAITWQTPLPLPIYELHDNATPRPIVLKAPHLLPTLLTAICSDAAITITFDGTVGQAVIAIESIDTETRDLLMGAGAVVLLDASPNMPDLLNMLNADRDDTITPVVLASDYESAVAGKVVVHQIPWFGAMLPSTERSEPTQNQLPTLLWFIEREFSNRAVLRAIHDRQNQDPVSMGLIDGKARLKELAALHGELSYPTLAYFAGHRGSNRLRETNVLTLFGLPRWNLTAAAARYSAIYGKPVGTADEDFAEWYDLTVGIELFQAMFRCRPLDAKDEPKHVVIVTDADLTRMPPLLQPQEAAWLPYHLQGRYGRTLAAVRDALEGELITITQAAIAHKLGVCHDTVARALAAYEVTLEQFIERSFPWLFTRYDMLIVNGEKVDEFHEQRGVDDVLASLRINAYAIKHGKVTGRDVSNRIKVRGVDDAAQGAELLKQHQRWYGGTIAPVPRNPTAVCWTPTDAHRLPTTLELR